MQLLKNGTVNDVLSRTSVKAGDTITIFVPKGKGMSFSVFRDTKKPLKFECNNSDKYLVSEFGHEKAHALHFMEIVCAITGLQAKYSHEYGESISFIMSEGSDTLVLSSIP